MKNPDKMSERELRNEVKDLRYEVSNLKYVLGMVQCEFPKGTWQRRDIDNAIGELT